mgnify:CR=1 FL=1
MEHVLDAIDLDCFAVGAGDVQALQRELRMREAGAIFMEGMDQFSGSRVPADMWNVLVYFREVQPSRLLPGPWVAP